MDDKRISISDAASALGVTVQSLRKRLDMRDVMESADFKRGLKNAKLYRLSAYPIDVQVAVLRSLQVETPPPSEEKGKKQILTPGETPPSSEEKGNKKVITPSLPRGGSEYAERKLDADLELVNSFEKYVLDCVAAGGKAVDCWSRFVTDYNAGVIEVSALVRELYPTSPSPATLKRKLKARQAGVNNLVDGRTIASGTPSRIDTDEELRDGILSRILKRPVHIYEELVAELGKDRVPHESSIRRWIENWKQLNPQSWALLDNPQAWRDKYMVAAGDKAAGIERPNQQWQMDATLADVELADGRHYLLGVIDVFSRRCLIQVCRTSNAYGQTLLLKKAFDEWGKPEQIKTDNGKDYASRLLTRALTDLHIEQIFCTPKSPWEKPFIERLFGTLTRDLFERLPGYVGHNVEDRKKIRERQATSKGFKATLTGAALQAQLNDWIATYERTPHSSLNGMRPLEKWVSIAGWVPQKFRPDEMDLLLAPTPRNGGQCKIQKKGIRIENGWYIDEEGIFALHIGETVLCRWLGNDYGKVFVCDLKGNPLFWAVNTERLGQNQQQAAINARLQQNAKKEAASGLRKLAKTVEQGKPKQAGGTLEAIPGKAEIYDLGIAEKIPEVMQVLEAAEASPKITDIEVAQARKLAQQLRNEEAERVAELQRPDRLLEFWEWEELRRQYWHKLPEWQQSQYRLYVQHIRTNYPGEHPIEFQDPTVYLELPGDLLQTIPEDEMHDLYLFTKKYRPQRLNELMFKLPQLRQYLNTQQA